jgi:hypothetical protein
MKDRVQWLVRIGLMVAVVVGAGGCSWLPDLPAFGPALTTTPALVTPDVPTATPTVSPTPTPQTSPQGMTLDLWVPEFLNPDEEGALT